MNAAKSATIIAMLLAHPTARAHLPTLPSCGSVDRDIGRGVRLTQYMFDGSSEFTLKFQPPNPVMATGVKMTAPFQLMISQMDFRAPTAAQSVLAGPHIGFTNYEFRKPDGTRLGIGALNLECGKGTVIRANYSPEPPPEHVKVPVTFHLPFLGQAEQQCLRELQESQHFKFTISQRNPNEPWLVIEDRMPLRWATSKAQKAWRTGLEQAKQGRCRLASRPPPPF